jgi:hypothetical protein
MRLTKEQPVAAGMKRPDHKLNVWKSVAPLLCTLAATTVLTVALPAKPDTPAKAKAAVTAQAKGPKDSGDNGEIALGIGFLVIVCAGFTYLRNLSVDRAIKKNQSNQA